MYFIKLSIPSVFLLKKGTMELATVALIPLLSEQIAKKFVKR